MEAALERQDRIRLAMDGVVGAAMIAAACVLIFVNVTGRGTVRRFQPPVYAVGGTLDAIPADVTGPSASLVLFVRVGCPFCEQSMDFYRRLAQRSRHVRLVVAGREEPSALQ